MAQVMEQAIDEQRVTLLEGFASIVGERMGYYVARKSKVADMSEATVDEREVVADIRDKLSSAIEELIKAPTKPKAKAVVELRESLGPATEAVKQKQEPFQEAIRSLAKGIRFCDHVAIPNSLSELGKPVVPIFSLSRWVEEGLVASKKRKS